jgi:hypothetical protein
MKTQTYAVELFCQIIDRHVVNAIWFQSEDVLVVDFVADLLGDNPRL